jgi:hypothetical protein
MTNNIHAKLFGSLLRSIETLGIEKTAQMIENNLATELHIDDKNVAFVLNVVANVFEIPIEELIFGKQRKNQRRQALGMITYFMYYDFDLSMKQISSILQKQKGNLSKYKTEICNLDDKHVFDKPILEKKVQIENQINLYKSTNNIE